MAQLSPAEVLIVGIVLVLIVDLGRPTPALPRLLSALTTSTAITDRCDVLVVGSGNAGFSAAISAAQSGAKVILIDKCPEDWAGGNSYFTAGAFRIVHDGLKDVMPLVSNVTEDQAKRIDLSSYTQSDFAADLHRVCGGRSDAELARILVCDSNAAIKWLVGIGVRFHLSFNRQAYEVDNRFKFWGGLCLKTPEGGKSLIQDYLAAAKKHSILVKFSTPLLEIQRNAKTGSLVAIVNVNGKRQAIRAGAIVLAAGGFEANPRMRSQFLGPGWDLAAVRGTPYNTGECLEMALQKMDASSEGHWSGCHSVAWDANANPKAGDREISNEFTKSGYPLGLMLNVAGQRFVDEGIDLRNYTYAKFGRAIMEQPEHVAFQVWDAQTIPLLRAEEYREDRVERITAETLEELADLCGSRGMHDREAFLATIREYNAAVHAHRLEYPDRKFNPAVLDRLSTQSSGLKMALAKSNWALPLDQAPFVAVKVTCGITFTFGGLKVDPTTAQMAQTSTGKYAQGIYCVGEMMGGLFYKNYPGGSGLTSGVVFGRRAGTAAAAAAREGQQSQKQSYV